MLLVADYRGVYALPEGALIEWAVLDTFDMLSPAYDQPQTLGDVREWVRVTRLSDVTIACGYGKIDARGVRQGPRSRS